MRLSISLSPLLALAIVALLAACAIAVPKEWEPLLEDLRAYQRRIGFERFDSFLEFSTEQGKYTFCGQVSRLYLPYSYEDPAIRWIDATEAECRNVGSHTDVCFGPVETVS